MNALGAECVPCPIGRLLLVVDASGALVRLAFVAGDSAARAALSRLGLPAALHRGKSGAVAAQLAEYFAGRRRSFDVAVEPGGTPFQRAVWQAMRAIPYGETRSYQELATALGRPAAARAVGRASATNPVPIVIPCHRLVGRDGSLRGFGGGLPLKRALLDLESARASRFASALRP